MTDPSEQAADPVVSTSAEVQPGGTTGAEHDGGDQQVAAESQDALDEALDGRSPTGATRPVSGGGGDPLAGSGAPVAGAGDPTEAVAADEESDTRQQ